MEENYEAYKLTREEMQKLLPPHETEVRGTCASVLEMGFHLNMLSSHLKHNLKGKTDPASYLEIEKRVDELKEMAGYVGLAALGKLEEKK